METSETIGAIAARLSKALGMVQRMEPQGFNSHYKYKFYSIDQIMAEARRVMALAGLSILPTPIEVFESEDGKMQRVVVRLSVTFMCEEGEWLRSTWTGEGLDTSDKAYNKAYTAAFKQCLQKTLMLGGDGDADEESPERPGVRAAQMHEAEQRPSGDSASLESREDILGKLRSLVLDRDEDRLDAAIAAAAKAENISTVSTEWLRTFKSRLGKYSPDERRAKIQKFMDEKRPASTESDSGPDSDVELFAAEQRRQEAAQAAKEEE